MAAWSTEQEQPASSKTRRRAASTGKTDGAVSMVSRRSRRGAAGGSSTRRRGAEFGDFRPQQQDLPADFRRRTALPVVDDADLRTVRAELGLDGVFL